MKNILLSLLILLTACSKNDDPGETSPTMPVPVVTETDPPYPATWSANDTVRFADTTAFDASRILDKVNRLNTREVSSAMQSINRIQEECGIYVAIVLDKVPAESLETEYARNMLSRLGIGDKPYLLLFVLEGEGEMPITGILAEKDEVSPLLSAEMQHEILRSIANKYACSPSRAIDSALHILSSSF